MSLRLVFIDVDDTILTPPHRAVSLVATLTGIKNFPTAQELMDRKDVEYYKAFPTVFKSKSHMWKMALASMPFGLVRSQSVIPGVDAKGLASVLADKRVFLISQNPPFLAKARVKHLEKIFAVDLSDRYIACGPIKGSCPSKSEIITCIRKLHGVAAQDCLLLDDNPKHTESAKALGIQVRLVDAAWNRDSPDERQRLAYSQLHLAANAFLESSDPLPTHAGRRTTIDLSLNETHKHSLPYFLGKFIFSKIKRLVTFRQPLRPLGHHIFKFDEVSIRTRYGFHLVFPTNLCVNVNGVKSALQELEHEMPALTEAYSKQELIDEMITGDIDPQEALKFAHELASSRSAIGVKILYLFYGLLIKVVFRNVNVHCGANLKALSKDNFILFIPQHRSIYDSSLLTHVIAAKSGTMPIIPAALKMKKNIVGVWGQLIGTFYIRREKVNETYNILTRNLIRFSLNNSSSAAIFVEGQRSRSGLSLPPKSGVFRLFLEEAARCGIGKIAIVPISFAYNQLPEAEVLVDEVLEEKKAGNSASSQEQSDLLIRRHANRFFIPRLFAKLFKRKVSEAYVSFGKPVLINAHDKDQASRGAIQGLLAEVMAKSNAAVPPLASSIGALAVTASPSRHQQADSLVHFLNFSNLLIKVFPKAEYSGVQGSNRRDFFEELNALPFINRKFKSRGIHQWDFVSITDLDIVLAAHYRNNVMHYFALPGLLAWLIENRHDGDIADLRGEFTRYATMIQASLFLPKETDFVETFRKILAIFTLAEAVTCDESGYRLKPQSGESPFKILSYVGKSLFEDMKCLESDQSQRRGDRLDISLPVNVNRTGGHCHQGKVLNLSKNGGECVIDEELVIGEVIEIVFDEDSTSGTKFARVVRKTDRGFGFSFKRAS